MIKAIKELIDINCLTLSWVKRHWKGYAIFVVLYSVVCVLPAFISLWNDKKEIQTMHDSQEKAEEEIRKYHRLNDEESIKKAWTEEISK